MKKLRLALGIAAGILSFFALVILPLYLNAMVEKIFPNVSVSSVVSYFFNAYTFALGSLISILVALGVVFNAGRVLGVVKAVQGFTGMVYFLYVFHFGRIQLSFSVNFMPVTFELGVALGLALIEIALLLNVIEGILIAAKLA